MVTSIRRINITILDRPRRQNLVVDFLSRINSDNGDPTLLDDTFPNEYFFVVSTNAPWFAYIVNYLSSGKFPYNMPT